MTHRHLHPEDASLYALGSLDPREAAALDREAATCDVCARQLAQACESFERIALADAVPLYTPHRLLSGRQRRSIAPLTAFTAVAAAIVIAVLSLWRLTIVDTQMRANDLALVAIAGSHFNHAPFTSITPDAPVAKALYARNRSWFYVIVEHPARTLRLEGVTGNGLRPLVELGAIAPAAGASTLFVRPHLRLTGLLLVDDRRHRTIAEAALP
jgi:hypothetical protein